MNLDTDGGTDMNGILITHIAFRRPPVITMPTPSPHPPATEKDNEITSVAEAEERWNKRAHSLAQVPKPPKANAKLTLELTSCRQHGTKVNPEASGPGTLAPVSMQSGLYC